MSELFELDPDGFEAFWALYPRRVAKGAARKAWAKATRLAPREVILGGLRSHLEPWTTFEKQFIPHPATWLNEERWDDDPPEPRIRKLTAAERARQATMYWAEREQQAARDAGSRGIEA